jgi:drug/metabolite transporter (DMT)-like permease
VPANRFGYGQFTAAQLKIIQEVISIGVFVIFSYFYLKEAPTWRTGLAFLLILGAVFLVVQPSSAPAAPRTPMADSHPSPPYAATDNPD